MLFKSKILKGSVSRKDFLSDIDSTLKMFRDSTYPMIDSAVVALKNQKYDTSLSSTFKASIERTLGRGRTPLNTVYVQLGNYEASLKEIRRWAEENFPENIVEGGLDARRANVIEWLSRYKLINSYLPQFLTTWMHEINGDDYVNTKVHKNNVLSLNATSISFGEALTLVVKDTAEIKRMLAKIPELNVTTDKQSLATVGFTDKDINPMQLGFVASKWYPAYTIGRWFAERRDAKYQASLEEKVLFENQLELMKKRYEENPDAKLEKYIQYYTDRVEETRAKVQAYEETL